MTPELSLEIRQALIDASPEKGASEELPPHLRLPYFLPTPSFTNALEPDIYLVRGDRGSGKTMLFRLLAENGTALFGRPGIQSAISIGFARVQGHYDTPASDLIEAVLGAQPPGVQRAFWIGQLGRSLLAELSDLPDELRAALSPAQPLSSWLPLVQTHMGTLLGALNRLDATLADSNTWRFILYDDLDKITTTYEGLFPPLRALFSLWLDFGRQWRRIRPKIFLRTDIFDSELLAFPDGAKFFAGHMVELRWAPVSLHTLLIKRLANQAARSEGFKQWLSATLGPRVAFRNTKLGVEPSPAPSAESFMASVVGVYMGANPRKGLSHLWVINHVSDARGHVSPRSWLRLFRYAAEAAELSYPGDHPLLPAHFAQAEVQVSQWRIAELSEEDPWIDRLKPVLHDRYLPIDADEFLAILAGIDFGKGPRPPVADNELVRYLFRKGLIEVRTDGRINVPDLYRHGFGLKRRGGISRSTDPEL